MTPLVFGIVLPWLLVGLGCWLAYQVLRQNGRILQRLEAVEEELARLGGGGQAAVAAGPARGLSLGSPAPAFDMNGPTPGANGRNGQGALGGTRSVDESKINRSGLKAGTPAPSFRLPRLDGGELSLEEYRGKRVLLVFSDAKCGPCDHLGPNLEQLARRVPEIQVLMVSRGDEEANRRRVAHHGLTFPVGLQRQWEVSRLYGMFATPMAYLIDEQGMIAADVAVGLESILALLSSTPPPSTRGPGRRGAGRR
jgi:peroxiredoxin